MLSKIETMPEIRYFKLRLVRNKGLMIKYIVGFVMVLHQIMYVSVTAGK